MSDAAVYRQYTAQTAAPLDGSLPLSESDAVAKHVLVAAVTRYHTSVKMAMAKANQAVVVSEPHAAALAKLATAKSNVDGESWCRDSRTTPWLPAHTSTFFASQRLYAFNDEYQAFMQLPASQWSPRTYERLHHESLSDFMSVAVRIVHRHVRSIYPQANVWVGSGGSPAAYYGADPVCGLTSGSILSDSETESVMIHIWRDRKEALRFQDAFTHAAQVKVDYSLPLIHVPLTALVHHQGGFVSVVWLPPVAEETAVPWGDHAAAPSNHPSRTYPLSSAERLFAAAIRGPLPYKEGATPGDTRPRVFIGCYVGADARVYGIPHPSTVLTPFERVPTGSTTGLLRAKDTKGTYRSSLVCGDGVGLQHSVKPPRDGMTDEHGLVVMPTDSAVLPQVTQDMAGRAANSLVAFVLRQWTSTAATVKPTHGVATPASPKGKPPTNSDASLSLQLLERLLSQNVFSSCLHEHGLNVHHAFLVFSARELSSEVHAVQQLVSQLCLHEMAHRALRSLLEATMRNDAIPDNASIDVHHIQRLVLGNQVLEQLHRDTARFIADALMPVTRAKFVGIPRDYTFAASTLNLGVLVRAVAWRLGIQADLQGRTLLRMSTPRLKVLSSPCPPRAWAVQLKTSAVSRATGEDDFPALPALSPWQESIVPDDVMSSYILPIRGAPSASWTAATLPCPTTEQPARQRLALAALSRHRAQLMALVPSAARYGPVFQRYLTHDDGASVGRRWSLLQVLRTLKLWHGVRMFVGVAMDDIRKSGKLQPSLGIDEDDGDSRRLREANGERDKAAYRLWIQEANRAIRALLDIVVSIVRWDSDVGSRTSHEGAAEAVGEFSLRGTLMGICGELALSRLDGERFCDLELQSICQGLPPLTITPPSSSAFRRDPTFGRLVFTAMHAHMTAMIGTGTPHYAMLEERVAAVALVTIVTERQRVAGIIAGSVGSSTAEWLHDCRELFTLLFALDAPHPGVCTVFYDLLARNAETTVQIASLDAVLQAAIGDIERLIILSDYGGDQDQRKDRVGALLFEATMRFAAPAIWTMNDGQADVEEQRPGVVGDLLLGSVAARCKWLRVLRRMDWEVALQAHAHSRWGPQNVETDYTGLDDSTLSELGNAIRTNPALQVANESLIWLTTRTLNWMHRPPSRQDAPVSRSDHEAQDATTQGDTVYEASRGMWSSESEMREFVRMFLAVVVHLCATVAAKVDTLFECTIQESLPVADPDTAALVGPEQQDGPVSSAISPPVTVLPSAEDRRRRDEVAETIVELLTHWARLRRLAAEAHVGDDALRALVVFRSEYVVYALAMLVDAAMSMGQWQGLQVVLAFLSKRLTCEPLDSPSRPLLRTAYTRLRKANDVALILRRFARKLHVNDCVDPSTTLLPPERLRRFGMESTWLSRVVHIAQEMEEHRRAAVQLGWLQRICEPASRVSIVEYEFFVTRQPLVVDAEVHRRVTIAEEERVISLDTLFPRYEALRRHTVSTDCWFGFGYLVDFIQEAYFYNVFSHFIKATGDVIQSFESNGRLSIWLAEQQDRRSAYFVVCAATLKAILHAEQLIEVEPALSLYFFSEQDRWRQALEEEYLTTMVEFRLKERVFKSLLERQMRYRRLVLRHDLPRPRPPAERVASKALPDSALAVATSPVARRVGIDGDQDGGSPPLVVAFRDPAATLPPLVRSGARPRAGSSAAPPAEEVPRARPPASAAAPLRDVVLPGKVTPEEIRKLWMNVTKPKQR